MKSALRIAALALVGGVSACGSEQAPFGLTYAENPVVYTAGVAIAPNPPEVHGGSVHGYSVVPALPPGLAMSTSTGVISGTPAAPCATSVYTVGASNSGGDSTATLIITVSPPAAPLIVTQPISQVVALDQVATFTVAATGTGSLTYQWSRDGAPIVGETTSSHTTAPATYLDDDGYYSVVVSDSYGSSVTSHTAKLRLEGFVTGGSAMLQARQSHAASKLAAQGKVLVTGGFATSILASAEIYDPSDGTFSATGDMVNARQNHTSNLLGSGRVLLAGGQGGPGGGTPLASAEFFDPVDGTFSVTGTMADPRFFHTATLLLDGTVLVAGGRWNSAGSALLDTAEVYDPATGLFATAGSLNDARYWHTATLLADGTVLVAGGYGLGGGPLDTAELYDPATGHFTTTGSMTSPRYGQTATLLAADGQVLIVGGYGAGLLDTAELYDPVGGTFAATGSLSFARHFHTATALTWGKVLVAGGLTESEPLSSAELYDPAFGSFTPTTESMEVERYLDTATLLDSGEVLVAGGWSMGEAGLDSVELFSGAPQ
jgi:hypothetical protein